MHLFFGKKKTTALSGLKQRVSSYTHFSLQGKYFLRRPLQKSEVIFNIKNFIILFQMIREVSSTQLYRRFFFLLLQREVFFAVGKWRGEEVSFPLSCTTPRGNKDLPACKGKTSEDTIGEDTVGESGGLQAGWGNTTQIQQKQ